MKNNAIGAINIKSKKKLFVIIQIFLIAFNLVLPAFSNVANASISSNLPQSVIKYDANDNSSVFPDSYKQYIRNLKSAHPNWLFKAVYTGLDWTESVRQESYEVKTGISTVPSSYSANWKKDGQNTFVDGTFVIASKKAVAYTLDPRNFLNETGIFQFEALDFNAETSTTSTVDKIISGTPMSTYYNQYKKSGSMVPLENGLNWSQIIINASKNAGGAGISSVFLASRMKQETSLDIINNGSVNGSVAGYEGVYNFFNIKATPNSDGSGSVTNGLIYAKSQGWTTPDKSINAGATEVWSNYIKWGQNTTYFQKFDVNNPYGNAVALYAFQYMTNILAPLSESQISYSAYKNAGLLDCSFVFYIPVYDNMPNAISAHPDTEEQNNNLNGTDIVYLDDTTDTGVKDVFTIRSGPGTSYDVISTITETVEGAENRKKFVRTQVGTNGWDKIKLDDGREGYVYQAYVKTYNYTHVTSVSLNQTSAAIKVGENITLTPTISPSNAYIKNVSWSSNNSSIASVDSNGKVTGNGVGSTTIVATTLDGNKTATCTVTVGNTLATGISVTNTEYPVILGNYLDITPTVSPSNTTDKSYDISIENQTIAQVENGKIKGLKIGSTKVTFTTKDGSNKSCTFNVKVTTNIATIKTYLVNTQGIVYNIPVNTTALSVKNNIESSYSKKILDESGNEIPDLATISTNSKIQILDGTNVVQEYTLSVMGDVNGDSKITASDYVLIKNHIMEVSNLTSVQILASDMNKDGKITASDYVLVKNFIMSN